MSWARVLRFSDPFPCQAAVQATDVEIIPTTKGDFWAQITQLRMSKLWMQRFDVSLPQISNVACKPDRQSIFFLTEANLAPMQYCGQDVLPGDIVINKTEVAHHRSGHDYHLAAMSLPPDDFDAAVETITGRGFRKRLHERSVHPDPALMSRLMKLHSVVGQLAHETPDLLAMPEVLRALESKLVHVMVRCLAEGVVLETTTGNRRHDAIIARFEEFLEANPDRPLYLTEICAAIGVAERTLRASCEKHLGMGPIRYLTLRRMHLVRRALLKSDPSTATVTQIVTDHGFWELGRFSVAYRLFFGETPSCTLRRPPANPKVQLERPSSLGFAGLA